MAPKPSRRDASHTGEVDAQHLTQVVDAVKSLLSTADHDAKEQAVELLLASDSAVRQAVVPLISGPVQSAVCLRSNMVCPKHLMMCLPYNQGDMKHLVHHPEVTSLHILTRPSTAPVALSSLPPLLTRLHVHGFFYGPQQVVSMAGVPQTLKRLSLTGMDICDVAELPSLTSLHQVRCPGASTAQILECVRPQMIHVQSSKAPMPHITLAQQDRLHTLHMEGCGLRQPPSGLTSLKNLKHLNLANNSISALPTALGGLVGLETLVVSGNPIAALPDSIGEMTSLKILRASATALTDLPSSTASLSQLRRLVLSSSQIRSLPPTLGQLRWLRWLDVGKTPLQHLPDGGMPHLRHLKCSLAPRLSLPPRAALPSLRHLLVSEVDVAAAQAWAATGSRKLNIQVTR